MDDWLDILLETIQSEMNGEGLETVISTAIPYNLMHPESGIVLHGFIDRQDLLNVDRTSDNTIANVVTYVDLSFFLPWNLNAWNSYYVDFFVGIQEIAAEIIPFINKPGNRFRSTMLAIPGISHIDIDSIEWNQYSSEFKKVYHTLHLAVYRNITNTL